MKEKIEQASIHELMPGFNSETEWAILNNKLHAAPKQAPVVRWYYAAAAIAAIIVSGIVWKLVQTDTTIAPAVVQNTAPMPQTAAQDTQIIPTGNLPATANAGSAGFLAQQAGHKHRGKITNGTPCPLAIRISQMMRCPDAQPAPVSTRSTMEPGQTAQLSIKPRDSAVAHCSFTVREIEITSIATGETIVLNASSTPSTAQEVYSYITGQKKGDVLAGMFTADCNNQRKKQSLTLASRDGGLVIQ